MSEKPTRGRGRPRSANPKTGTERVRQTREARRQAGITDINVPASTLTRKLLGQLARQRGMSQRNMAAHLLREAIAEAIKRNK